MARFKPFERSARGNVSNYIDTETAEVVSRRERNKREGNDLRQKELNRAQGWGYDNIYQYNKSRKLQAEKQYKLAGTKHYGYSLGNGDDEDQLKRRIQHSVDVSGKGDRFQVIGRKKGTSHTKGDKGGFSTPPVGMGDFELIMSYVGQYLENYELDPDDLEWYVEYIEDYE